MKMYVSDWTQDTAMLDLEENGLYDRLVKAQWQNKGEPLPNDTKILARLCFTTERKFKRIFPRIEHYFVTNRLQICNQRVAAEFKSAKSRNDTLRANGEQGGRPKSLKNKKTKEPKGSVLDNQKGNHLGNQMANQNGTKRLTNSLHISDIKVPKNPNGFFESPDGDEFDIKMHLFGTCMQWLMARATTSERNARSVIGAWIKKYGDETVLVAFSRGYQQNPLDAIGWLTKTLEALNGSADYAARRNSRTESDRLAILRGLADEMEAGRMAAERTNDREIAEG